MTHLLSRDDAVLICIDFQERLVPAVQAGAKAVENMRRLLAFAKIVRMPVVITEQEKLGPTVPELADEMGDFLAVPKTHFNCFFSDLFVERLRAAGRKTLIVAGLEAHICVAQTALFALEEYSVHVVADAISSRTAENVAVALQRMTASGVTVTSTEMVIYEILRQAGTDEFKAALKLVK